MSGVASTPNDRGQDATAIRGLLEQYRAGFAALDPQMLAGIWDRDHVPLVYVAQEVAAPLRGWAAIEAYYDALPAQHPASKVVEMRVDDITIDVFGETATAFCCFRFVGEIDGRSEPFVANGRTTFVCHRTGSGWKVLHYHESAPFGTEEPH